MLVLFPKSAMVEPFWNTLSSEDVSTMEDWQRSAIDIVEYLF